MKALFISHVARKKNENMLSRCGDCLLKLPMGLHVLLRRLFFSRSTACMSWG